MPKHQDPPRSSFQRRDVIFDTHWNPHNFLVIIRFLTMSHILSECKVVIAETGPPTQLSTHLDLQSMHNKKFRELEALQLETETPSRRIKSQDGVSQMKRQCGGCKFIFQRLPKTGPGKRPLEQETKTFGPGMPYHSHQVDVRSSIPESFVAANDRHISCVSSYVSILLLLCNTSVRMEVCSHSIPITKNVTSPS